MLLRNFTLLVKVNDIRVAEAPKEDKFEKAILKKHGDEWKKKVDIGDMIFLFVK